MTDSTDTTGSEQPEVEGHKMRRGINDAEAPQEADAEADEAREGDEPEVEGHKFKLR